MIQGVKSWKEAFSVYRHRSVISMIFLGFAAGLPFLLVFSTLSAWLRDEGTSKAVIGFFSWVGITYSIKVLWAPVIDRMPLPILTRVLGRRRSWLLVAQSGIALGLIGMSFADPHNQLQSIALLAVLVAFSSATQDVVVDAFRIESAKPELQGAMAATYVLGYRIALLVAGAGTFYLAEFLSWATAYQIMAALMLVGITTTLWINEPIRADSLDQREKHAAASSRLLRLKNWFKEAVVRPFLDFFERNGKLAILILGLVAVYKLSDITMGVMANPFYLDLGFSKTDIADVSKIFGFFMTIAGAALGGLMVVRYGLMRPLLLGAVLVALTNLLFAMLATMQPSLPLLAAVVSADNLSGGIASSVFIAWLSSLTNQAYTATQYALFSSLMTLPAKFLGGFSGIVVESYGYFSFFIYASAIGTPAILLTWWLMRVWVENKQKPEEMSG